MITKNWTKGISKKTGKEFFSCLDGRTQWNEPDWNRELKKINKLNEIYNVKQNKLNYIVKHLLINFITLDFKDLENYTYTVLDLGSCYEHNHESIWIKEGASKYFCMDLKPSHFKGDIFSPKPWEQVNEKIDIFCFFDSIHTALDKNDLKILFCELEKKIKDKSRIICILNNSYEIKNNEFLELCKETFKISFYESVPKILNFIGVDSEKFNASRLFEWNLFYKPILDFYKCEGFNEHEWYFASNYKLLILEKNTSLFIKSVDMLLKDF
jgi:hypothetical protein